MCIRDRIAINHGQFELQLDYSQNYDEAYSENNLDTILQNNPLNDSMIEEIKSIPGVTDVMTREIVSVNLNGTRFPADIVSKNDFEMCIRDRYSCPMCSRDRYPPAPSALECLYWKPS